MAARKVSGLLDAGAEVLVISPEIHPLLQALASCEHLRRIDRPYRKGMLQELGAGARSLVIAATDERSINEAVYAEGDALGCLVNVVDDPAHSHFILPAVVRRGEVQVAVSTGGASPALTRRLRERLEGLLEPEYAGAADLLGELRPDLLRLFPPGAPRREAALSLIDAGLLERVGKSGRQAAFAWARAFLHNLAEGGVEA